MADSRDCAGSCERDACLLQQGLHEALLRALPEQVDWRRRESSDKQRLGKRPVALPGLSQALLLRHWRVPKEPSSLQSLQIQSEACRAGI